MNRTEWKKLVMVAGRLLLGYALIFTQCAWAGQNQKTTEKANSPQKAAAPQTISEKQSSAASTAKTQSKQAQSEESESSVAEEKPSSDPSHQGIKVHGHWTIEVRNPDGTVVTRREFENSLFQPASSLAAILARTGTTGAWAVRVDSSAPGLCAPSGTGSECTIAESSPAFPGVDSTNMTVGVSAGAVTLSATMPNVPSAGTITLVRTLLSFCPSNVTPNACVTSPGATAIFTSATNTSGFASVAAGQTLAVTVVLSFS
jgi:hypothetical protein